MVADPLEAHLVLWSTCIRPFRLGLQASLVEIGWSHGFLIDDLFI